MCDYLHPVDGDGNALAVVVLDLNRRECTQLLQTHLEIIFSDSAAVGTGHGVVHGCPGGQLDQLIGLLDAAGQVFVQIGTKGGESLFNRIELIGQLTGLEKKDLTVGC